MKSRNADSQFVKVAQKLEHYRQSVSQGLANPHSLCVSGDGTLHLPACVPASLPMKKPSRHLTLRMSASFPSPTAISAGTPPGKATATAMTSVSSPQPKAKPRKRYRSFLFFTPPPCTIPLALSNPFSLRRFPYPMLLRTVPRLCSRQHGHLPPLPESGRAVFPSPIQKYRELFSANSSAAHAAPRSPRQNRSSPSRGKSPSSRWAVRRRG